MRKRIFFALLLLFVGLISACHKDGDVKVDVKRLEGTAWNGIANYESGAVADVGLYISEELITRIKFSIRAEDFATTGRHESYYNQGPYRTTIGEKTISFVSNRPENKDDDPEVWYISEFKKDRMVLKYMPGSGIGITMTLERVQ